MPCIRSKILIDHSMEPKVLAMVLVHPVHAQQVPSVSGTDESSTMSEDEHVEILGELVGALDLVVEDDEGCELQPFCIVKFGDCVIHQSEAEGGKSPIWTIESDSLFLLKADPESFHSNSLSVHLFTTQKRTLSEVKLFLGQVTLTSKEILEHCDGERFEVVVEDELGDDTGARGHLALRFRFSTPADSKFVRLWNSSRIKHKKLLKALLNDEDERDGRPMASLVTETSETEVAGESFFNALSAAFAASTFFDRDSGLKKKRVKPGPDPERPETTKYLSPHELNLETRKPSSNWVEAGSGKLGRLYVEVLSCHDLPNVDVGEAVGNVTDSFVALVFEDAFVETPVIDDELNPRWLPWTQRAFCFGIMHPASMLYIGVFDYDLGITDHEPIGRVAVNVSNLQRDTQYTLRYNLFKSSNVTDRTPQGQITIRLRIKLFDEKAALLTALSPRPSFHVNVNKPKSFKVVRYVCFGEYDGEEKFDLKVARSYVNEIFEYKRHISYAISDSICSLIFWRGQVEFFSIRLPLHSILFFLVTSTLVERPYLLPSFLILSIPWIMIANGRLRRQHPSPWYRCPTFFNYLDVLLYGSSKLSVHKIIANEGLEESLAYELSWRQREQDDMKKAEKRAEMQQELMSVGDESIHTAVAAGIPIDLLERLGRYQGYIGAACRFFRKVKIILLWEESVISFWITAVFLGIGLVSLVLPWAFILTWLGRIVVHGFFGPHMKILDLYLRANKSDDLNKLMEAFDQKKRAARLRREQALKVKAVKCLRFGDYITQVPAFNLARHYDCPLPSSTAKIVRKPPKIEFTSYSPGQQLYGDMIPRLEDGYLGNQIAVLERMKRLSALESRLVLLQAAARVGGELLRRRRQLRLKPPSLEEFTPESGYELVQLEAKPLKEVHIPSPDMSNGTSKRMSVKETNGHTYLIMECSGENSMEEDGEESNLLPIKLPEDEFCDEVGVDIVLCEDESVLWSADEEQTNYYTGNLALVFKESETTFVTFYRS